MARTLERSKGRKTGWHFVQLPTHILDSEEFADLSHAAVRALVCLFSQYRGSNNGDFTAAWSIMQRRGWKSKGTLYRAINELLAAGWIVRTRQGSKNRCSLYAVTWHPVDACGGKLDIAPTRTASGSWKRQNRNGGPLVGQGGPTVVPIRRGSDSKLAS